MNKYLIIILVLLGFTSCGTNRFKMNFSSTFLPEIYSRSKNKAFLFLKKHNNSDRIFCNFSEKMPNYFLIPLLNFEISNDALEYTGKLFENYLEFSHQREYGGFLLYKKLNHEPLCGFTTYWGRGYPDKLNACFNNSKLLQFILNKYKNEEVKYFFTIGKISYSVFYFQNNKIFCIIDENNIHALEVNEFINKYCGVETIKGIAIGTIEDCIPEISILMKK